jgi:transcriptional regulator with XRE-family HTH domain
MKMHNGDSRNSFDCDANGLLDALLQRYGLKNDAALCRVLDVQPCLMSKIRHGKQRISADMMLRIHEVFDMPIAEMRTLMRAEQFYPRIRPVPVVTYSS